MSILTDNKQHLVTNVHFVIRLISKARVDIISLNLPLDKQNHVMLFTFYVLINSTSKVIIFLNNDLNLYLMHTIETKYNINMKDFKLNYVY